MNRKKHIEEILKSQPEMNQAKIARGTGLSPAAVSGYLSGSYKGNLAEVGEKIYRYITAKSDESEDPLFCIRLRETGDFIKAGFILKTALKKNKISVIYGSPGTGKTYTARNHLFFRPDVIFIECDPKMTYSALLSEICNQCKIERKRRNADTARAIYSHIRTSGKKIVIDEAENLTLDALEGARRIWDKTNGETAVVLIGTHQIYRNLLGHQRENEQIYSRVFGRFEMQGLSEDEFCEICKEFGIKKIYDAKILTKQNFRKTSALIEVITEMAEETGVNPEDIEPREAAKFLAL